MPVPPLPEKPAFWSGSGKKEAYERALKERQAALDANKRREAQIIELAKVGLATKGQARRRLPGRLADVEEMEGSHAAALALAREAKAMVDVMDEAQRAEVIAKARARLAAEEAAKPKPAAKQPAEGSSRPPRRPKPR